MPNKYPNTPRNRYAKDELSALSHRGDKDYPEWLEQGGEDGREAERKRLMEDVHGKDEVGMVDAVVDLGAVTPVGMAVNSVAEAGEEIRKDPTKVRSYLNAVRKFGESGAVDPDKGGAVSDAMIPRAGNINRFREEMLNRLGKHPKDATKGDIVRSYLEVRRPVLTRSVGGGNMPLITIERDSQMISPSNEGVNRHALFYRSHDKPRRNKQGQEAGRFGYIDTDTGEEYTKKEYEKFNDSAKRAMKPREAIRQIGQPIARLATQTDDVIDTATHELMHGAQKYREPGMFLDYTPPDVSYSDYYNHPSEIQARQAGTTGKQDFLKFQRTLIPEDKQAVEAYMKARDEWEKTNPFPGGSYNSPARRDWEKRQAESLPPWPGMEHNTRKWLEEGYDPAKVNYNSDSVPAFLRDDDELPNDLLSAAEPAARTWIDPKGKKYDLDLPYQSHEDWLESNYNGPRREALREGYIRESNDIIQVDDPSNPQLSLPLRRAAQYGPVNVQLKNKDYFFTPQELSDAYFDLPTAIANQRKYKSKSTTTGKD
jgi:hypothetical protein